MERESMELLEKAVQLLFKVVMDEKGKDDRRAAVDLDPTDVETWRRWREYEV